LSNGRDVPNWVRRAGFSPLQLLLAWSRHTSVNGVQASQNHSFIDGNKRTALGACLVFLRLNGLKPKADGPEWEELTLAVAPSAIDRDEATRRLRKLLPRKT
jgi:prophage maintenance system killer protein